MSDFTHQLKDYLPDDFEDKTEDYKYVEQTVVKNYVVPIIQDLRLEHADYKEISWPRFIKGNDCRMRVLLMLSDRTPLAKRELRSN